MIGLETWDAWHFAGDEAFFVEPAEGLDFVGCVEGSADGFIGGDGNTIRCG